MNKKIYLTSNELTRNSFELAYKVWSSGFRPDVIIALWRGGTPVGIAVHEFFHYKGCNCYNTVVKTVSYTGIGKSAPPVIENIDYVMAKLTPESRILVVDDIFDTGKTAETIKKRLENHAGEIKFAMPYFKPSRNMTSFKPDYFVRVVSEWLVFPHELVGLTQDEIRDKDKDLYDLLNK